MLTILLVKISGAQDKTTYVFYNKLTELQGTEFVMAAVDNMFKLSRESTSLLFINTVTGEHNELIFARDASIHKIEQVKLDSFHINKILIAASTLNLDGNKGIDWNDPTQLIVCSTDGTEKMQITQDKFFVRTWVVNRKTGIIVITGHYDSNENGKYDKADVNQIVLFDLKTMKNMKEL